MIDAMGRLCGVQRPRHAAKQPAGGMMSRAHQRTVELRRDVLFKDKGKWYLTMAVEF